MSNYDTDYDYNTDAKVYTPEQIAAVERCYPDGCDLSDRVVAQAMAIEAYLATSEAEGIDREAVSAEAQLDGHWMDGSGSAYRVEVSVYDTHTDEDGTYDGYKPVYRAYITV